MNIPTKIMEQIGGESFEMDTIGLSDSSVLLFEDKVLKIQPRSHEAGCELQMMRWLRGKLPVPEILAYEEADGKSYLLMSRVRGQMSCTPCFLENPAHLARLLAKALKRLWRVDIGDCPVSAALETKLAQAEYRVAHQMVDVENVEPDTFGENGFENPEALLSWLKENRPEEEKVLSHGDFCLPNVIFQGDTLSGFIDLGRMGVADKWCDIALCYRSLCHNFSGKYNGVSYPGFRPEMLFAELGLEPDWQKIRYYILLDELF